MGCLAVTLVAILGAVGGAGYLIWSLFFGPVDPEERSALTESVSGFSDVCKTGRQAAVFTAAEPYVGNGPHLMAVFGDGTSGVHIFRRQRAGRADPERTQPMFSWSRARSGLTPATPVKTCFMEGKNVPLREATYEVTVYEARSRRVVATLTLVGESTACPFIVTYREGTDPKDYTEVTPEQYARALQPFTTGTPKPFID